MSYRMRRGLGTMIATTIGGTPLFDQSTLVKHCSAGWLSYFATPQCWQYEMNAWRQMSALPDVPNLTVPPKAIPSALEGGPATVAQAETETNAVLADAWAQQHENIRAWGSTLPDDPIPDVPCTWFNLPCWVLAVGLGVGALGVVAVVAGTPRRYGR